MPKARKFQIIKRHRDHGVSMAEAAHFTWSAEEEVDVTEVLGQAGWSLYSFEPDLDRACFVRLPEGNDLSRAPFAYTEQFEQAVEGLLVPLSEVDDLARDWAQPERLTILLGTGRARSTLASAILATQPGVWSLSEPDSLTNLARARVRFSHEDMARHVPAAVRLAYTPLIPSERHMVIKPRSQATFFAADIANAFPQARVVYLYRDAIGWVGSMYKVAQRLGMIGGQEDLPTLDAWNVLTGYCDPAWITDATGRAPGDLSITELLALCWARNLQAAREALGLGIALEFVGHDALAADNPSGLAQFFAACGIDGDADLARPVFNRDSQKGSALARDIPARSLDDGQREGVRRLLEDAPHLLSPLPLSAISDS